MLLEAVMLGRDKIDLNHDVDIGDLGSTSLRRLAGERVVGLERRRLCTNDGKDIGVAVEPTVSRKRSKPSMASRSIAVE